MPGSSGGAKSAPINGTSCSNTHCQVEGLWGLRLEEKIPSRLPSLEDSVVSSVGGDEVSDTEQATVTATLLPQAPKDNSIVLSPEILRSPPKLKREPLRYKFTGLAIWLEIKQTNSDLSNAIQHFAGTHGLLPIPRPHITALYGMTHMTTSEAIALFRTIPSRLPGRKWPTFQKPVGVLQDVAFEGVNGEFANMAWSELTFATNDEQELAVDALHEIFYGRESKEFATRQKPFKPHASIAYDNPENTVLNLADAMGYALKHPSLLEMERKVEAISLW
eukprot:CAMPEP_0185736754 /NCGR_PEP_ID=MMETSP1171-20130828/28696_1 /TAXON_ID=374046 /ORGANISM="Helicotheca tamensis, Strain CCMP826" /LENGTH=276 /DNA_ID=CAMNT_0028407471 /DNA_START=221 /DNA_END=1048 /DNA_ORIENTATION=+